MYLVKSPLKNNNKDYKIGDLISPESLSPKNKETLLKLGVISLEPPQAKVKVVENPKPTQSILGFVNSSDIYELSKIKGVGEATAKAIVSHRGNNGLFSSIEQLEKLVPSVNWKSPTFNA